MLIYWNVAPAMRVDECVHCLEYLPPSHDYDFEVEHGRAGGREGEMAYVYTVL